MHTDLLFWIGLPVVGLIAGFVLGIWSERRAWLIRAINGKGYNSTPHHCDGEFYYILTEKHFCEEFQRKPIGERP